MRHSLHTIAAVCLVVAGSGWASAQDAVRGAMLYTRLETGTPACLSCHGPDPAANFNNILRAADRPGELTKVLSTVGAMGYLNSQLTEADRADLSAYLGGVSAALAPNFHPQGWPQTLEFGTVALGGTATMQRVRLANDSNAPVPLGAIDAAGTTIALSHDCPDILAPHSACTIQARMRPTQAGWNRAALRVALPGAARPFLVGAAVLATVEPASTLIWQDGAEALTFAPTSPERQRRKIRLTNPGPMPARIEAHFMLGPQASRFVVEQGCAPGTMLQAGVSCEMEIGFTPSALAAESFLRLRSDQGNPTALLLRGEALPAAAPITPPPVPPAPPVQPPPQGGGGCSTRQQAGPVDPVLPMMVVAALAMLLRRRWS